MPQAELREISTLLDGSRTAASLELLVSTARDVLAQAEADGTAAHLRGAGAELLVETCSYLGPVPRPTPLPTMTDSAKWAWYAPANIGVQVVFASREECVRSAIDGRVWRDPSIWGDA